MRLEPRVIDARLRLRIFDRVSLSLTFVQRRVLASVRRRDKNRILTKGEI